MTDEAQAQPQVNLENLSSEQLLAIQADLNKKLLQPEQDTIQQALTLFRTGASVAFRNELHSIMERMPLGPSKTNLKNLVYALDNIPKVLANESARIQQLIAAEG